MPRQRWEDSFGAADAWAPRWIRICALRQVIMAACLAGVAAGQEPATRGRIGGVVRDSAGARIVGAQVSVSGTALFAETGLDGRFGFARVPVGTVHLDVRRLGFRARSLDAHVGANDSTWLDVVLSPISASLPAVIVRERHEPYDARLAGFNARRARRVGHFITREEIVRRGGNGMIDLLRAEPSVRVTRLRGVGRSIVMRGMNCAPLVVIDGFPASAGPVDLDMIDPSTVEGIEIYSSSSSVPSELIGPRGLEQCGVIAIWSHPSMPRAVARVPDVDAGSEPIQPLLDGHVVFTETQVQRPAAYVDGSLAPDYPDSLWTAGRSGSVVAEFVVDSTGLVRLRTLRMVSLTAPEFGAAIERALPQARFEPARLGGARVPQVVRMRFEFDPTAGRVPEVEDRKPSAR